MFIIGAICLVTLFAIGLLPKMWRTQKLSRDAKEAGVAVPEVQVTTVLPTSSDELVLPGNADAIEDAVVGARTTGYISKRFVDIGSHVKAGQVLAVIESPDVDAQLLQADAQSAQARAQVEQSRADVFNKQATIAQQQSTVQQAIATREQARANLADSQAKLTQLQAAMGSAQAQLKEAQHNVDIKKAALRQAETTNNLAKVTYDRYESLFKEGFVAAQDVDQYEANYKNATAAVNSAESDVAAAQSSTDAAEQAVQGAKANIESGKAEITAAQRTVDAATAIITANQANVRAAQATLRGSQSTVMANQYAQRANEANSRHYKVLTSFENVVAPFSGVITARNVDVGSLVNSGSGAASSSSSVNVSLAGSASSGSSSPSTTPSGGLFGVARTDVIRILVSVPAVYARDMRPGLHCAIDFDREFPGRVFDGVIAKASGALDAASRTLLTEIHIDNQKGDILPGMFGQVHFKMPHQQGAVRVPSSAVMYDALGTRVAVVGANNKLHFQAVRVGRDYGQVLEILSGLTGKESIVYSPSDDLIEGEEIDPVPAPPVGQYGEPAPKGGKAAKPEGGKPGA
jgi:multidrug efflux pump subunit AcrA (membrane-fusion protein)